VSSDEERAGQHGGQTTTGSGAASDGTTIHDHNDWAAPVLACGTPAPGDPVLPVECTVFSFESGTEEFTIADPGDGGTAVQSTVFHTDGDHGLEVTTPAPGPWFGRTFPNLWI
jgi:alpha-galactosidase